MGFTGISMGFECDLMGFVWDSRGIWRDFIGFESRTEGLMKMLWFIPGPKTIFFPNDDLYDSYNIPYIRGNFKGVVGVMVESGLIKVNW